MKNKKEMDERRFRPLLCTVKAELGQGQPGQKERNAIKIAAVISIQRHLLQMREYPNKQAWCVKAIAISCAWTWESGSFK